jgi:hypothetical protein
MHSLHSKEPISCPRITKAVLAQDGLLHWHVSSSSGIQAITQVDNKYEIQQCQTFAHNSTEIHILYWSEISGDNAGLWICDASYTLISWEAAAKQLELGTAEFTRLMLRFLLPRKQRSEDPCDSMTLRGLRFDVNYPGLHSLLANALLCLLYESDSTCQDTVAIESQLFETRSLGKTDSSYSHYGRNLWLSNLITKGSINIWLPSLAKSYRFRFPLILMADGFAVGYFDPDANSCLVFVAHSSKAWILIDFESQQLFASAKYTNIMSLKHPYFREAIETLVKHAMEHEAALYEFYDQGFKDAKAVVSCRDHHIGHYLWNSLSGLQHLEDALANIEDVTSVIRLVYASGPPIFCPLQHLFPRLLKQSPLTQSAHFDMITYTYTEKCQYIRATDDYISAKLADAIRHYSNNCDWLLEWGLPGSNTNEETRRRLLLADSNMAQSTPRLKNICLYLRINNRAPVNQHQFIVTLIQRLFQEELATEATQIYICGSNTASGDRIFSHYESDQGLPDWVKEQGLAMSIIKEVNSTVGHCSIHSMVGASINHELYLVDRSDLILIPWGAGMAKTKWILNKTCYVHTNILNLTSFGDLRIYEDPNLRENAAQDVFFPLNCIIMLNQNEIQELSLSDPEGFELVKKGFDQSNPSRLNYRLDLKMSIDFIIKQLYVRGAFHHPASRILDDGRHSA